ncbi:Protein nrde2 [Clydaea vesicula]|uniref:Protein nrde2 n=1 Tax=Clydaea vesicula TaxID=447962 RepID=A0AAD5U2K3_9FUNG|nr:Protein nrde2 [Clydaea vesicula]
MSSFDRFNSQNNKFSSFQSSIPVTSENKEESKSLTSNNFPITDSTDEIATQKKKRKISKESKKSKKSKKVKADKEVFVYDPWSYDKKGDKQMLIYQSVYKPPSYKRISHFILGQNQNLKLKNRVIDFQKNAKGFTLSVDNKKSVGQIDIYKELKKSFAQPGYNFKTMLNEEQKIKLKNTYLAESNGFIPLTDDAYFEKNDFDNEPISFSSDTIFTQKIAEFTRELDKTPRNLKLWIEYINYQDELLNLGSSAQKKAKAKIKFLISEKKLSIFEKALKIFPDEDVLLDPYLTTCQEIMDDKELLMKWDEILRINKNNLLLIVKYIKFRQSNFQSFSFSDILDVYTESLEKISSIECFEQEKVQRKELTLVFVISKACYFMAQAGYIERAIATFQAIIEFTCFPPPAFAKYSLKQKSDCFESYWESEVPRFGESGSLGWSECFLKDFEAAFVEEPKIEHLYDHKSEYFNWGHVELLEEYYKWNPQRTESSETQDVEDPFRCVVFEDVSKFLFLLTLKQSKLKLINNFIQFLLGGLFRLNLNNLDNACEDFDEKSNNLSFLQDQEFLGWQRDSTKCPLVNLFHDQQFSKEDSHFDFNFPFHTTNFNLTNYFTETNFSPEFGNKEDVMFITGIGRHWIDFLKRVLLQSSLFEKDSEALLLLLRLESLTNLKSAKKLAKSWLKKQNQNLILWNAYARLEARKVYATALNFVDFNYPGKDIDLLFYSYAELEFNGDRPNSALSILSSYAEKMPPPPVEEDDSNINIRPTRILKVQKLFNSLYEGKREKENESLVITLSMNAMFEFIVNGVEKCFNFCTSKLKELKKYSTKEKFMQNFLILLKFIYEPELRAVNRNATCNQALLREIGWDLIHKFPQNNEFLKFFCWNERKFKIDNKVNLYFERSLNEGNNNGIGQSHLNWIFFIAWNLKKGLFNNNLVRGIFDNAIESNW